MKMIINLIQHVARTLNTSINAAPKSAQRLFDLGARIRLGSTREDACDGEEGVGIEGFEEVDGFLEEIGNFFLRGVVDVAGWVKGADAGTVFAPFVLPVSFISGCAIERQYGEAEFVYQKLSSSPPSSFQYVSI